MASSNFKSAAQVAMHVLQQRGPQTTHQLHKACLEIPALADKPYIAPHHIDYRVLGNKVHAGTVTPPNPEHLVRSVRFLKDTLRKLNAAQEVGHTTIEKWRIAAKELESSRPEVLAQAKELEETIKHENLSPWVWVHGDLAKELLSKTRKAKTAQAATKAPRRVKL